MVHLYWRGPTCPVIARADDEHVIVCHLTSWASITGWPVTNSYTGELASLDSVVRPGNVELVIHPTGPVQLDRESLCCSETEVAVA